MSEVILFSISMYNSREDFKLDWHFDLVLKALTHAYFSGWFWFFNNAWRCDALCMFGEHGGLSPSGMGFYRVGVCGVLRSLIMFLDLLHLVAFPFLFSFPFYIHSILNNFYVLTKMGKFGIIFLLNRLEWKKIN